MIKSYRKYNDNARPMLDVLNLLELMNGWDLSVARVRVTGIGRIEEAHTRQLLSWLRSCNKENGFYNYMSAEDIKAELATREHIPNKPEARRIRQLKAFAKKHR